MGKLEKFFEIILSDNACNQFFESYKNENFKNWLLNLIPEIEDCKNQKQNNPWHVYDCLKHILKSVENMNSKTKSMDFQKRKMLAFVMFLHDTGKPKCHITRTKNGRQIDSFFNHNEESAKIAERVCKKFGFNDMETKIITELVLRHDVFINLYLPTKPESNPHKQELNLKFISNLRDVLAEKLTNPIEILEDLVLIGQSDASAQNPKMTKQSFEIINEFSKLVERIEN